MRCLAPAKRPARGQRTPALLTGAAALLCAAWTFPASSTPGHAPAPVVSPGGVRDGTTAGTVALGPGQVPASEESSNWSGYEDTGAGSVFTQVSASWTVPVLEQGITGSSSTWVGIDGATTADLIQAGTEQDWTVSGPLYYAWYELLPGTAVDLGPVKPGDRVSANIEETATGKWTISITDSTSGSSWTEQVRYNAPGGSAEWVVEAPSAGSTGAVEPLAAFGSVSFSALSATGPNTQGATAQPVYLVHEGNQLIEAYPGPYDVGSDTFTDYFGSPEGPVLTSSVVISSAANPPAGGNSADRTPGGDGYWLAGATGGVFSLGDAHNYGSAGTLHLHLAHPVVAIVPAPRYRGYWLIAQDGGVFGFGGAPYEGSLPSLGIGLWGSRSKKHLTSPIVDAAPSADGKGYFMVSANGGVFSFGDARYEGSCASAGGCKAPVRAIVPDGPGGYWLLLSNCQTLAMGSIPNIASLDCQHYAKSHGVSAVAAARTPNGHGYWALLSNGVVFAEGDAKRTGDWVPPRPSGRSGAKAVALFTTAAGDGAWVVFSDGKVKAYGHAPQLGSVARSSLSAPIVASAGW